MLQDQPNVYTFGTPYNHILRELEERDKELYTRNGLLKMLERNVGVKEAPQKWQENSEVFDVVLCFEERVFDVLVEDLNGRDSVKGEAVLVINMNVKDNHEEAAVGADDALHLCEMLQAVGGCDTCPFCSKLSSLAVGVGGRLGGLRRASAGELRNLVWSEAVVYYLLLLDPSFEWIP
eukprot:scaffold1042_cov401-Prasinococcus_capsulatus_cf.AAC.30